MAKTTDELFAEATEADYETAEPVTLAASDTEEEFQFRIDEHLRTIAIPEKGVVAGVEGDLNVNIARFTMTRYYHGRDLSKLNIRINYRNANGQVNYYTVSDATVSGDSIVFSWEFAADVTQYKGNVQFVVYLFSATNAVLKQRFFTTLGTLEVLEGLEVDSSIPVSEQTDILLHLKKDLSAYAEEVKKSLPADYTAMTEQVNSLKGEALKGAEFTVYKMQGGQWVTYTKAEWKDEYKAYRALNLHAEDSEGGKFKVVETKNPTGYTGTWEHEFTAEKEGVVTLTLDATNARKTGQITITKTGENNKKLSGAVFEIKAAKDIKTAGGTTLVAANTVVDTVTTDGNGSAASKQLELGQYIVKEKTAPDGYVLDTTEHAVTLDDSHTSVNVAVQNQKNAIVLQKVSKNDGTVMEGVTFHIWNDDKSYDKTQKTDSNGRITIDGVKDGTWHYQETATKDGYVLDNAVKDFTVSDGKVNGQSNLTITVENDYTKLDLAKVDSGTGENISGAKLSLLDSNGRLVESWTSGSTPHRIEKLKPGQYTLREDQAPDYYKLADPITFTLESKADTQTITMKDMRYADLTIVKKIKASDITWAHGNPTFIFTVKGKDINGKDRTFQNYVEFTENYVNSHTDGQGYVELSVTWNKIPVGEDYTVTEQDVLRYHLVNVTGTENVKISKLQEPAKGVAPDKIFSVHANLKAKPTGTSITFENQKDDWGTTTHDTSVKNIIPLK